MAEEESDQEAERLGEELEAIVRPPPGPAGLSSRDYCRRFCQVVEDYAGRWQVPLPQLQVLQTALCCFTSASVSFPAECEHVQYVLSSLALSFFELLLFFGKDEFYEEPLKDILGSIQECQNLLSRYGNVNLELVTRIIRDGGPWEDPVLQAVLKARPASPDLVNKYLSSENPLFFELRARYLIACERIPEAMALIKSCINHPDISKDLYFHQAFFTCLYMSPLEDQLFQEHLLRTDCKNGIDIICNTEKEGKTMLALQLCESFLIPQLQNGDMYCIWDLIFIWSKLQLKANPSKQVFVDQCYQLLRTATNVRVIFPFMKVIKDEVEVEGLQICVEICGCALQLDLRDDPNTKCLIYKTIANFLPNDLEILRICALSIFFLERSLESYYTVEHLYKRPDEEYNERTSSVQNRVRFELLPILKKGLFFDPEFWNFIMIKQNCAALLRDKSAVGFLNENTLEHASGNTEKAVEQQPLDEDLTPANDLSSGELDPEDVSRALSGGHGNAKKNLALLGASKVDHNVPRHRCVLCNREFLGGHIVRHAQAHQKKGSFSCVICGRKFRNRGLMLKHLRNHVKKIQRQHLAALEQEDLEIPIVEEMNCPDASVSFENGKCDSSKEQEMETAVASNDENKEEEIPEQVAKIISDPVCEPEDVVKNGSHASSLNDASEPPLNLETLPEYEEDDDDPNQESLVLNKVNGVLCTPTDLDVMDQQGNFKCPANGCVRIFKKIRFLNKHARKAHPADFKVQQHIMKWNKGKCRFCQRKFADSQHFIDHLKRHIYPNVFFCLHFNCNQRFKLSTELAEHMKSHSAFKAQCHFPECCELFEELPLLYEHEAKHYLNQTPESSAETSENNIFDALSESHLDHQEKDLTGSEKETVDLPVPTWKSRKDSTEPKTYIQSVEKKTHGIVQNGSENSSDVAAPDLSLLDQKMPVVEPNSENSSVVNDRLVNGHSELEQTSLVSTDAALKGETSVARTENGSVLPNVEDVPQEQSAPVVSQSPFKPNLTTENTSYGLIVTKPYVRPLPPSYLDERYISMPKRRKTLTDKVDNHSEQDKVCNKSVERFRCGNCLNIYCNSEALEAHLAQKKCQALFGFDSDDESA
ncbi:zinc finger protein 654 isoform X1 [Ornithorhynchus anatinus]|uniref:Zinc finger protein 654 n=2 Tax=Ornithorhynchus anatinus TaxID=9258 RepID=A0A6I8NK82_ORNAN|nr:zinc finger protein 654 isoform X1 [Ornithorhynchus anatinus]